MKRKESYIVGLGPRFPQNNVKSKRSLKTLIIYCRTRPPSMSMATAHIDNLLNQVLYHELGLCIVQIVQSTPL
jgi:hypothetical protein